MRRYLFFAFVFFLTSVLVVPVAAARSLEFETTEVTGAEVALSPDGQWLVFTMLGHLFRLPVEGGTAEQLTFGPYYDSDPVFSPDGTRVAFVSDRDGSESNVFVLAPTTGKITQVTREARAMRPAWTPDGRAIVYLRPVPAAAHYRGSLWGPLPSLVRRVALDGGEPETLSAPAREIRSLFYLPDGRLAWTALEREPESVRVHTRIEVLGAPGERTTLRLLEGIADRVVPSPTGEGLYCRRILPLERNVEREHLLFLPLPEGREREIYTVTGSGRGFGTGRWHWSPAFAVAADEKTLYVGNAGRLWKVENPGGASRPIDFSGRVKLEIQDLVPPLEWSPVAPGDSVHLQLRNPVLSPDRGSVIFTAGGYLWEQVSDNGPAQRMFEGSAFEGGPALSPDGNRLAFTHFENGIDEIRILDLESGETSRLDPEGDPEHKVWSPDGSRIAFTLDEEEIKVLDVGSGEIRAVASGEFHPHLSWSVDGKKLIFCDHEEEGFHQLVAVNVSDGAREVLIDELPLDAGDARLSPDGESLYFSTNCGLEIWVAPLGSKSSRQEEMRRVSPEGGDSYGFTPGGSALVYSFADRVWRLPLGGGKREEIPVRLEVIRPPVPPVLVRRVRVLDLAAGRFGAETSLYIEQGRIRWMGSDAGRRLPPQTVILDAGGRFAIPGLFDMHHHGGDPAAYVAYGITSVRNTGGGLHWLNTLAARSEITRDPLPRYFHGGYRFIGPRLTGPAVIANEEDARACTRRWRERGAGHIKAYASLPWPLHRVVAEEARLQGLPIIAHGESIEEVTKGVTLGYWSLEHLGSRERFYDDMLQMLALAGTRWDPTLGVIGHGAWILRNEPDRLDDPKFRAFNSQQFIREVQQDDYFKAVGRRALLGFVVEERAGMYAAHRRGVRLLAGGHAPYMAFPGASLHWELEHLVESGIEPLDVLRIATHEGAAAVGAEDDLGTLEPGKLADLVLLEKNPLDDIRNTQTIWRVIKDGQVYDPQKLQRVASTGSEPN